MSPYEITEICGSIEHWNDEPGETWIRRMLACYPDAVWLNPTSPDRWMRTPSAHMIYQLMEGRMFPLTADGVDGAMKSLRKGGPSLARR